MNETLNYYGDKFYIAGPLCREDEDKVVASTAGRRRLLRGGGRRMKKKTSSLAVPRCVVPYAYGVPYQQRQENGHVRTENYRPDQLRPTPSETQLPLSGRRRRPAAGDGRFGRGAPPKLAGPECLMLSRLGL
ncbi:hypothetical protein SEVIR_4G194426v4 [Setaria viridis]